MCAGCDKHEEDCEEDPVVALSVGCGEVVGEEERQGDVEDCGPFGYPLAEGEEGCEDGGGVCFSKGPIRKSRRVWSRMSRRRVMVRICWVVVGLRICRFVSCFNPLIVPVVRL